MSGFAHQSACWDLLQEGEEAQAHLKTQAPNGDETFFGLTTGFWFFIHFCVSTRRHKQLCDCGVVVPCITNFLLSYTKA